MTRLGRIKAARGIPLPGGFFFGRIPPQRRDLKTKADRPGGGRSGRLRVCGGAGSRPPPQAFSDGDYLITPQAMRAPPPPKAAG